MNHTGASRENVNPMMIVKKHDLCYMNFPEFKAAIIDAINIIQISILSLRSIIVGINQVSIKVDVSLRHNLCVNIGNVTQSTMCIMIYVQGISRENISVISVNVK